MLEYLPTLIDPRHLAFQGYKLKGRVMLAQMFRLHEYLCEGAKGEVEIDWLFATDEQKRPIIKGSMQTELPMLCQRCLQTMLWPIDIKVALMMLPKGQTENDLPKNYEALTLTSPAVPLITLIEDELILALPIMVLHTTCSSNKYQLPNNLVEEENIFPNNPFSILSKLKVEK
ncbi:YceD family protein [Candidatus Parabeggiatoa sp. HSG14]|uniref:YceD family protein n=1 Tax=Candidatus Parabeggiatoa sp. HSG14 TaxID=3055593 RepID=UPI0025A79D7B|nr:YceD family protein [Thiotrichales bacterium HSG14]